MSVFITGASSGIGEACATQFAEAGHSLVLAARREDRLTALGKHLRDKFDVTVDTFGLDVRNRDQLESLVRQHPTVFNSIDVLINNAGLAKGLSTLQEGNPEDWDTVIDTNIKGLLYVTRAILPKMISQGRGHVVNIGSVAGHWVYEKGNVYCASKFAVRALTEGLRFDLAGTGIRVTEISPGMVETEFSEVRYGDREKGKAVYAGKKPLSAQDIAETVLWCIQRPAHVDIQEIVIFPTEQASVHARR
jgi:3-hydroxy acid dehydrogenase/malonic semialdehyde reductase